MIYNSYLNLYPIYSALVPQGAFLSNMVTLFALQSALIVTGLDQVKKRCTAIKDLEKEYEHDLSALFEGLDGANVDDVNLENASSQYDQGASYFGSFEQSVITLESLSEINYDDGQAENAETKILNEGDTVMRRHLHLLIQLCLLSPRNLESLFNLYAASAAALDDNPSSTRHSLVCRIIQSELCNILPSLASSFPQEKVLERVFYSDPKARKLVLLTLETLYSTPERQVSSTIVSKVKDYATRHSLLEGHKNLGLDEIESELLSKLAVTELLVPIISGLSATEIVEQLPLIIVLCLKYGGDLNGSLLPVSSTESDGANGVDSASMTALFHCFNSIVQGMPPALSKTGLLYALHRY